MVLIRYHKLQLNFKISPINRLREILKTLRIKSASWTAFWRSRSFPKKLSKTSKNLLFLITNSKQEEIDTLMKTYRKTLMKNRMNLSKFLLTKLFILRLLFTKTAKVSWEAPSRDPEGSNVPYKPQNTNPKVLITFSKVFFKTKTTKKFKLKLRLIMIGGFSWFSMSSKDSFWSNRFSERVPLLW